MGVGRGVSAIREVSITVSIDGMSRAARIWGMIHQLGLGDQRRSTGPRSFTFRHWTAGDAEVVAVVAGVKSCMPLGCWRLPWESLRTGQQEQAPGQAEAERLESR